MLIVLDCPSCAKRYEVNATLAGKRSRCKQCGEIFKIPVPNATADSLSPTAVAPPPDRASDDMEPRSVSTNQPAAPIGFGAVASPEPPAFGPRAGIPARGGRQRNPGNDAQARVLKFIEEHGDRAATIMFTGISTNSDPAKGVTAREVSAAILARIRELAPGATNSMWRRRNNRLALALSPVDDIPAFVRGIDFGTTTVRGDEIDVILSPEFVASVPRLPPEAPVDVASPGTTGMTS